MALLSPAKLRAIADRLERDVMAQVAELRRQADMMDGVKRVRAATKKPAKKVAKKKAVKSRKPMRGKGRKAVTKSPKNPTSNRAR